MSFVDTTVQEIDTRLKQLQEEITRLEAARSALVGARRGPGRPRGRRSAGGSAAKSGSAAASAPAPARARSRARRKPGRPRGRRAGNTRANQALELVRKAPGITIPKIAQELKIEPNYLYRVMPKLVSEGLVRRDGLGYHPANSEG